MPTCEQLNINTLESTYFSVEMWSLKMELLRNLCRTVEHNLKITIIVVGGLARVRELGLLSQLCHLLAFPY